MTAGTNPGAGATPGAARTPARILALEPWLGGSHARFLEAWRAHGRHRLEVVGLPARHWKWRLAGATWALGEELRGRADTPPDLIVASSMLDLSGLAAFLPRGWRGIPTLLYLHETQASYPERPGVARAERDHGYALRNVLSCLAADAVVFNSAFHRDAFARDADALLSRLPKPRPRRALGECLARAHVVAPAVDLASIPLGAGPPPGSPLRVVFNHRREHDKDPAGFLDAVRRAVAVGAPLELLLLGERSAARVEGVDEALAALRPHIVHDGYAESRPEYDALLGTADLVVSTARHEFFGHAVVEALAAGASPLLPRRLAYPEVLPADLHAEGLYDGEEEGAVLAARLAAAAADPAPYRSPARRARVREAALRHDAARVVPRLDALCDEILTGIRKDPAW